MARSRSRGERDATDIARPEFDRLLAPISRPSPPVRLPVVSDVVPLLDVEDTRRFDFNPPEASARSLLGTPAVVVGPGGAAPRTVQAPPVRKVASRPVGFTFADARQTVVCVRRKQRREVLFAVRRTRAGSGAKRRRKAYTDVRC